MSILQTSAGRTFRGQPIKLTEGDMVTLEAMGVSIFGLPDDAEERQKTIQQQAARDMILGIWLATRDRNEKKAAFSNPEKAKGDAFEWYESDAGGDMEGFGVFYDLLQDRKEATLVPEESGGESGELPP